MLKNTNVFWAVAVFLFVQLDKSFHLPGGKRTSQASLAPPLFRLSTGMSSVDMLGPPGAAVEF